MIKISPKKFILKNARKMMKKIFDDKNVQKF